jgi:serine/threonine protein kinase
MFAGTQFGRYEIRSKIGEGGMGEVYSAHDNELDRDVAIKLLPNEFVADDDRRGRFKQEARVVSALNHPNILTIYEIGENEHGSFLATEFVEGKTLRAVMKSESLTLSRMLKIVEQAANALVAAHAAHIVHRDIKPENIMVRSDAIVKVLDFGLAKAIIELGNVDTNSSNKTMPGTVMGSARYMSPEQARGHEVDERTDIWSVGVVLYELLTGMPPFDGSTTADTIAAVVYKEPLPLTHILPNAPFELQRIVRKALQKDREERYQSIKDLSLDIKDLLYALDHANSGDRAVHVLSDPSFSENPTMIHSTVSGNRLTGVNTAFQSQLNMSAVRRPAKDWIKLAGVFAAIAIIAAAGFGFYNWYAQEPALAAAAFERPQVSRVNTDGRVVQPAISPDAKYIAYVSGEVGSRSLVVRQVATDSTLTVVQPTNLNLQFVSFSPEGNWVYFTETRSDFAVNTLYQVPTLGGTPKKLIEDVDGPVTFSPDGKTFAFYRHVGKTNEDLIVLADVTTLEQTQFISSTETNYNFFNNRLAWSPDGRKLLTGAGTRKSGFVMNTDIIEIDLATKALRKINDREFLFVNNFAWFSDGSGFVFTGRETQNGPSQVWRSTYPTVDFKQVTNDTNDYAELGISADGRNMITIKGDTTGAIWSFSPATGATAQMTTDSRGVEGMFGLAQQNDGRLVFSRSEAKEADLWTSDKDGKNGKAIFAKAGFLAQPTLTPDGRYIVFNLQKDKASRIWRMDANGQNAMQLSEESPEIVDFSPQVTPDGQHVIFQRQLANKDSFMLMRVSIDGGPAEVFFQGENIGVFGPKISPDGKRIAFGSYDMATFEKKINVATLDGNAFGKIERVFEYNLINQFGWSPDSKSLTILTNRGGNQNVWRMPINGSPAVAVTDFKSGRIFNFAWAVDGKNLLLSRGNTNNDLIMIRDTSRLQTTQVESADRREKRPSPSVPFVFSGVR